MGEEVTKTKIVSFVAVTLATLGALAPLAPAGGYRALTAALVLFAAILVAIGLVNNNPVVAGVVWTLVFESVAVALAVAVFAPASSNGPAVAQPDPTSSQTSSGSNSFDPSTSGTSTETPTSTTTQTSVDSGDLTETRIDANSALVNFTVTPDTKEAGANLSINGVEAEWGFWGYCSRYSCDSSDVNKMYINLGRDYKFFDCIVGVEDDSLSQDVRRVVITADGVKVLDEEFGLGTSKEVHADVDGKLRIEITFYGELGSVNPAIGEPKLLS